jgi:hypothetical protein
LVAQHFGLPQAKGIVEMGSHLDLSSREKFDASLEDEKERQLVAQVETLAQRPDRRFFHWEIEFPEVFFGFIDADERQIKHKDKIKEGSAGFDAIVGNPPYVRQEVIKPLKPYLKQACQTFDSTNDLYVYFQEIEIRNLQVAGRMGMIVANKWMRSGYGERLRDYLQRTGQPLEVIDFGHSPIFPDADTFPCILLTTKRPRPLAEKEAPSETEAMAACEVPRDHWHDRMDLRAFVSGRKHRIPTRLLRKEGWSLEDPRVQLLLDKLRNEGVPLQEFCGSNIFRGCGTGLNEAFFIDADLRDRLVKEHKRSAEIILPLLRGRNLDRWQPRPSEMFIIFTKRGTNIDNYPAVKRHLAQFRGQLEPRPADWDEEQGKWPGRRPGDYRWYELQDSPSEAAANALAKPKIVFQEMAWFNRFGLDRSGAALTNTAYVVPETRLVVVAVLNSPLAWWYMWRVAQHGKDEVLRLIGAFMDEFPMPPASGLARVAERIDSSATDVIGVMGQYHGWEKEVVELAQKRFALPEPDGRVVTWLSLSSDIFSARLLKLANVKKTTPKVLEEVECFRQTHRTRQTELLSRQLDLEKQLASWVEDAYGLTPEERNLLRSTRPVRDPLDVLEGKLRGRESEEVVVEE